MTATIPPRQARAMCNLSLPIACCLLLFGSGLAAAQKPPPLPAPVPQGGKPPPLAQAPAEPGGKPPPLPPGNTPFGAVPGGPRPVSSGTGFVVAPSRVLTNHHVANGCAEMRIRTSSGAELSATVAATDQQRDLALLTVRGDPGPVLSFRSGPEVRRGEGVVTYGFPLSGILSSGPTLTTGDVSALAGLRDNAAQFQISAPVQPGNSGGPLFDLAGNVMGVIVSKLNAQRIAQSTGDIPQNVNFAVKGAEAVDFLRRNGVQPRMVPSTIPPRSAAEVGEVAHPSTVFLRCLR
ncbi:S1C family serine protease [Belnapia mucosa]|uniref:S1C family serine protease n=1 Tax=Belnapia mucosa TaxID=2804532 RepID=UPI001F35C30E|nr:serine protease [Belnapia mucosa]